MKKQHEISYINNPKSLFRKYTKLVTWFANTSVGKQILGIDFDEHILLLLPNGYKKLVGHTNKKDQIEAVYKTRASFSLILYPALKTIDFLNERNFYANFTEMQRAFLHEISLVKAYQTPLGYQSQYAGLRFFTFNPDANPESTSVDGYIQENNADWATCRNSTSATSALNDSGVSLLCLTNTGYFIARTFTLFDTSSLSDTDTIASASYTVNVTGITGSGATMHIVPTTPASNTALVVTDYDNLSFTNQSDSTLDGTSTGSKSVALNATGIGNISKTGITKFGLSEDHDYSNSAPGAQFRSDMDSADQIGTVNDPTLTVLYAVLSSARRSYSFFM